MLREFENDAIPAMSSEATAYARSLAAESMEKTRQQAQDRKTLADARVAGNGANEEEMLRLLAESGSVPKGASQDRKEEEEAASPSGSRSLAELPQNETPISTPQQTETEISEPETEEDQGDIIPDDVVLERQRLREENIPLVGPGSEMATPDEPEDGGDIAKPTGEGDIAVMNMPLQFSQGEQMGDASGSFILQVLKFNTYPLPLSGRVWHTPLFGSEEYSLRFTGPTTAPRDVLTFATYVVRSSSSVQMGSIILYLLVVGGGAIIQLLLQSFGGGKTALTADKPFVATKLTAY